LKEKVERSHSSDEQEFYQLFSYEGDVELGVKLAEWKRFYNLARLHDTLLSCIKQLLPYP